MTVRKLFFSILTVVLLFVATGCDSNGDDDESDADVFVGTWMVTSIGDDDGDATPSFNALVDDFSIDFAGNGTFDLTVDFSDAGNAAGFSDRSFEDQSYAVNESTGTVTLTIEGTGVPFDYEINSNNQISLSTLAFFINEAMGLPPANQYNGDVNLVIERQ